jgi:hypothetical protein
MEPATRRLCDAIQASASAVVAKLVTVVGWVSGTVTSTPKVPSGRRMT